MSENLSQTSVSNCSGNNLLATSGHQEEKNKRDRSRGWVLTIYDETLAEKLKSMDFTYCIIGKEHCPTTGRLHFQSYVHFKSQIEWGTMEELFPKTWFRKAKAKERPNQKYCSKENIWFEGGKKPYSRVTASELEKMTNREIIEMDPRCAQAYIKSRNLLNNELDVENWKKEVTIYYIWGPSGCGKTEKTKQIIRDNKEKYGTKLSLIKYEGGFYNGLADTKIAVYDDWRDSHMKPSEFINLIDYNRQQMNVKGGGQLNNYELIIITTVQDIKDIYKGVIDTEPKKQWERRLKVIELNHHDD